MTNLLLGATGFMGGHLVEYLFKQGEISKGTFRAGSHLKIMDSSGVQGVEADLLDHHSLHEALEGVDTVYSLASPMPDTGAKGYEALNREGIRNLLEAAREAGVMTFVHLSTLDVYGFKKNRTISDSSEPQPDHPYQRAKLEADKLLLDFAEKNPSIKVVIVRSSRAIGPRDRTVTLPILKMAEAGAIVLPPGELMSFSHPKDVAQAMHKSATSNSHRGRIYLVKSFDSTIDDLSAAILTASGRHAAIKRQGFRTGKTLLPGYAVEQIKASLRIQGEGTLPDLGYSPSYDIRKLGEDVAEWYRREPWVTEE